MFIRSIPEQIQFSWTRSKNWPNYPISFLDLKYFFLLLKGNGIILNKSLLFETSFGFIDLKREFINFIFGIKKIRFNKNAVFVSDMWSDGPYHFYVDVLSRLVCLNQEEQLTRCKNLFLVDSIFMRNTGSKIIKLLFGSSFEINYLNPNHYYIFIGRSEYIFRPHPMGSSNKLYVQSIRLLLEKHLIIPQSKSSYNYSRIYYFRKDRRRTISNESQVLELMNLFGFYCTDFEGLSYLDSYSIMKNAKYFFGIHGGGLTNMLFMPPNGTIIEFKTDNINPRSHCYHDLAINCGHNYYMFIAKSTDPFNNVIEGKGCDICIDISALYVELMKIFNQN